MSISGISSSMLSQLTATSSTGSTDPMQQAWQDLENAIESGDIDSAKSAFETIQKLHAAQVSKDTAAGTSVDTSDMDSAMEALGEALDSGDLSSVEEAYATLKSTMKEAPSSTSTSASSSEDYVLELLSLLNTSSSSSDSSDLVSDVLNSQFSATLATALNKVDVYA